MKTEANWAIRAPSNHNRNRGLGKARRPELTPVGREVSGMIMRIGTAVLLLVVPCVVNAATYYVDTNGTSAPGCENAIGCGAAACSTVLALAQPLNGMTPDSPAAADKKPCPGAWVRQYEYSPGKPGRVFASTYGASEDIVNDDYRRMLVNACFWAAGLEDQITPTANIDFVGSYNPVTFSFGGNRKQVKPSDLAGWESPIMSKDKPTTSPQKK